jgi:septum formation topological specificity factor MinE
MLTLSFGFKSFFAKPMKKKKALMKQRLQLLLHHSRLLIYWISIPK